MAAPPSATFQERLNDVYRTEKASVAKSDPLNANDADLSLSTSTLAFIVKQRVYKRLGAICLVLALTVAGFTFIFPKNETKPTPAKTHTPTVSQTARPAPRKIAPVILRTKPKNALVYDDKSGKHLGTTPSPSHCILGSK